MCGESAFWGVSYLQQKGTGPRVSPDIDCVGGDRHLARLFVGVTPS